MGNKIMVKKIGIACLCMALGSSLNAAEMTDTQTFIGVEVGYSEVQGQRIGTVETTDSDVSYGFRIGAQTAEWRTTLLYNYFDSADSDQNTEQGLATLDYFLLGGQSSSKSMFKPYIGANIGYVNYESSFVDEGGMIYGGQAGVVVNVAETVDLDFSYRHSLSSTDALDHVGSFIFSVNYLF